MRQLKDHQQDHLQGSVALDKYLDIGKIELLTSEEEASLAKESEKEIPMHLIHSQGQTLGL